MCNANDNAQNNLVLTSRALRKQA